MLHFILRYFRTSFFFDMDFYWPVSIFLPKYPVWQDFFPIGASLSFFASLILAWKQRRSFLLISLLAYGIIVSTNLFQGTFEGFIEPVAGESKYDHQYWQDVDKMTSIPSLLNSYTTLQPTLLMHSRVHPPGAMIFFYALRKITSSPVVISLFIGLLCVVSAFILRQLLLDSNHPASLAEFWPLLFLLLPSISIYGIASLDAVIMFCFLLTFWAFQQKGVPFLLLAAGALLSATFLTFAGILLLPMLLFDAYKSRRDPKFLWLGFGLVFAAYFLLSALYNYNYLTSFLVAKSFEGSQGFYALTAPLSYLITRLEDVLEILVFFGPYLSYLLWAALKEFRRFSLRPAPFLSPLLFLATFVAFLIAGAYYTGETARAALFVYPFLVLLLANTPLSQKLGPRDQQFLLLATFTQSFVMQLFGSYSW